MGLKRKICKIGFVICNNFFPEYNYFRFSNKIKNFFAKGHMDYVGKDINWGKHVHVPYDFKIGDYSGVGNNAYIGYKVVLGKYVMIGRNVTIFTSNHITNSVDIPMCQQGFTEVSPLIVEDDVWICEGVIITPNVNRIGHGSILAAGSVITKDVTPYSVVAGNPGVKKYDRRDKEKS